MATSYCCSLGSIGVFRRGKGGASCLTHGGVVIASVNISLGLVTRTTPSRSRVHASVLLGVVSNSASVTDVIMGW